jgi:hypothetical protein
MRDLAAHPAADTGIVHVRDRIATDPDSDGW